MDQVEIDTGQVPVENPRDDAGRIHVSHMSDRQLLEEIVTNMRFTMDAFVQMQQHMNGSAIGKMLGIGK